MEAQNSKKIKKELAALAQPAFLICAVVLGIAALGMSIATKKVGVVLKKEPLELRKSLGEFDSESLGDYRVVKKAMIGNEEIVESLGTQDYIHLMLENTAVSPASPLRYCSLFITYYPRPDNVLHIPDECFIGSGYKRVTSDNVAFKIKFGGKLRKLAGRCIVFKESESQGLQFSRNIPILYLFKVNDAYAAGREQVRMALNKNILGSHSYFSKVEWRFYNHSFIGTTYPGKSEAIEASKKLLGVVLPVLEKSYWPDWESI